MTDTETDNESTTRSRAGARAGSATSGGDSRNTSRGWDAVVEHVSANRMNFILAVTRMLTVLCTISYLIGFPGPASNRFKQALLMNAATSSLRLHQRMPPPALNQLSRVYFMNLIREDSFHYLIFPFMFFPGYPVALALLPCALYAIFNLAVYSIDLLDKLGDQENLKAKISELVTKYQQSLLHTVALSEVALLPILVVGFFTRFNGPLVVFVYYRFLVSRYNSSRNAHLKLLVSQIQAIAINQYQRMTRR